MDTKQAFDAAFAREDLHDVSHEHYLKAEAALRPWMKRFPPRNVLDVGCGLGHTHQLHPNWRGIEYSGEAVRQSRVKFHGIAIEEGDARDLRTIETGSIDFLFTFAAFEHIPEVERAFAELHRVLRPGGVAYLAPAWNCRPWTVKRLQQRPMASLPLKHKIGKALIPLREHLAFRALCSLPRRVALEAAMALGFRVPLVYRKLEPDFSFAAQYPHLSDCDAFVSLDAHSAIAWFVSRGYDCLSHPGAKRFMARGDAVVVRKPVE